MDEFMKALRSMRKVHRYSWKHVCMDRWASARKGDGPPQESQEREQQRGSRKSSLHPQTRHSYIANSQPSEPPTGATPKRRCRPSSELWRKDIRRVRVAGLGRAEGASEPMKPYSAKSKGSNCSLLAACVNMLSKSRWAP